MEPIALILAALAAGSMNGVLDALSDEARDKVKAAIARLHSLLRNQLADDAAAERVLDEYVRQPEPDQEPLAQKLADSGAAEDPDLLVIAQRVLVLVDAGGAAKGRYNVSIRAAQGVQIGSYSTQVNTFNSPPSREGTGR